ncbi:MAG: isocitrate/isopropylmalate family dehydrogenase, partial [Burkholderiales bacterium]|nr:isocitrate/isopropylmalate family dehydrogenase [Burkholderiales bacterium]
GDGIGPEVCRAAVTVLKEALGEGVMSFDDFPGGASHYVKTGQVLPPDTFDACKTAHAMLHGAAGLPNVTYPDGTEVGNDLHLQLRFKLDLYANVRPIRLYQGDFSPLKNREAGDIDYVIVRENTEGLYASRGAGVLLRGEVATDTLVLTRKGCERIARFAFELSRKRNGAPSDRKRRMTVCDKANILRSYAFFRSVCDDVAKDYPDVAIDYAYVDAITDLGAATVGGMGIAPSGELGDRHGLFQGAHGSAPDIAGQNIASPLATVLSGSFMLRWLGDRHTDQRLLDAAQRVDRAVELTLAQGKAIPRDLGGLASCSEVTQEICRNLK